MYILNKLKKKFIFYFIYSIIAVVLIYIICVHIAMIAIRDFSWAIYCRESTFIYEYEERNTNKSIQKFNECIKKRGNKLLDLIKSLN